MSEHSPTMTTQHIPTVRTKHSRPVADIYDDEPRTPSSAVRFRRSGTNAPATAPQQTVMRVRHYQGKNPVPQRTALYYHRSTEDMPLTRAQRRIIGSVRIAEPVRRRHWLVSVSVACVVMIVGYVLLTLVMHWWAGVQDNWRYGYPRTAQYDVVVGHHDDDAHKTHFTAQNLHGKFSVIEIQGGDPAHTQMYVVGPTLSGDGADLVPITLEFRDVAVNGKRDGKPDLLVHIQDTVYPYLNDQVDGKDAFRPVKPEEQVTL